MSPIDKATRRQHLIDAYRAMIERGDFIELLKLKTNASLSRFSLGNLSLLMWEAYLRDRPLPTMLCTYKKWQDKGRQVRKGEGGEKAWHVLGPNKYTKKDPDDPDKKYTIITGFHWITEFDISQTDGPPIMEQAPDLESCDFLEQFLTLAEWAIYESDIPIRWSDRTGGAKGWYRPSDGSITLQEGLATDEALAVLIHELVHQGGIGYDNFSRPEAEMIAETATCLVCMALGLEHIEQSLEYVAHWAGKDPERAMLIFEQAEKEAEKLEKAIGNRLEAAA